MMRVSIFFSIIFFFAIQLINAQTIEMHDGDTINRTDADGKKQGLWILFDNSKTQKQEEGLFVDNRRSGIWKKYYSSNKVQHEITYFNGKPNGFARFYYENGNVSEEGIWRGDKWVGGYKYYFENGNLSYDWKYNEDGKREGVQKYYHENGNVMIEGDWKDGQESGVIKEYYENGSVRSEKNFAGGILDTTTVKHYEPKNVVVTKPVDGDSQKVGVFDGNGYYKTYTSAGKVDREGVFKGGKFMDGKRFFYDEKDNLVRTEVYRNGKIVDVLTN